LPFRTQYEIAIQQQDQIDESWVEDVPKSQPISS
jgi:hypothetical protein